MHIDKNANIAKIVLIAEDPKRTQIAAENLLEDPVLVSDVRNAYIYTGTYQGHKVSFATSGMGQASIAIYVDELINYHNVETIIRIGTCGAYNQNLNIGDIVEAKMAFSDNNIYEPGLVGMQQKTPTLKLGIGSPVNIYTNNTFYCINNKLDYQKYEIDVSEMESFAMFYLANYYQIKTQTVCMVSNVVGANDAGMSVAERETKTIQMYIDVLNHLISKDFINYSF